jgi:hypothetical protein
VIEEIKQAKRAGGLYDALRGVAHLRSFAGREFNGKTHRMMCSIMVLQPAKLNQTPAVFALNRHTLGRRVWPPRSRMSLSKM